MRYGWDSRFVSFPSARSMIFDGAFAMMTKAQVGGLIVITDPLTLRHRVQIVQAAVKARVPSVYGFGEFARAGGLMAYGPSGPELARRAAT